MESHCSTAVKLKKINDNKLKDSGANVIKLITAVSYVFSYQARVFVPCKPFQDSIVFASKAGAYPSENNF
jgi:hypothetical protein